jgi:hypothetical protein
MFEYLSNHLYGRDGKDFNGNLFYQVTEQEILEGEKILGYPFPAELKAFWREVGCGNLCAPHNHDPKQEIPIDGNAILPPKAVANFAKGVLFWDGQEHWMSETTYEYFIESGYLPFFEISDSSSFMVMKTRSDNPGAIWLDTGSKIEDSLEKFIHNLYYKNPFYYVED